MKSVDRPPANPKRITIESSQEFFSVEISRSASTGDPPNTKHYVHRPAPVERPSVIHKANDQTGSGDDDDDFMTPTKNRNATGELQPNLDELRCCLQGFLVPVTQPGELHHADHLTYRVMSMLYSLHTAPIR